MWSRWRWGGSGAIAVTVGTLELCARCSRALAVAVTRARRAHWDVKTDYEALVAAGELNFDPLQQQSVERLQSLQLQLAGYEPPSPPSSFLGRVSILLHIYVYIYNPKV